MGFVGGTAGVPQVPPSPIVRGYDGTITVGPNGNLVNGHGTVVQLRGANIQGSAEPMNFVNAQIGSTGVTDCWQGNQLNDQNAVTTGTGAATALVTIGPNTTYMQPWKFNCVRIGINESSWMGYTVYNTSGTAINPNNYGIYPLLDYRHQITLMIAQLNAIGCYVELTLAWTNPGRSCAENQDIEANQDNSIQCWQSLASYYGFPNGSQLKMNGGTIDNRSVIFEMFNEPVLYEAQTYQGGWMPIFYYFAGGTPIYPFPINTPTGTFTPGEAFTASNGTTGTVMCYYQNTTTGYQSSGTQFLHTRALAGTNITSGSPTIAAPMPPGTVITGTTSGATATITSTVYPGQPAAGNYGWYAAGNQQLIAAIRAAGAGNVCLCSGANYAGRISNWLTYMSGFDSTAPAGWNTSLYGAWTSQIGAHWHPYPAVSTPTGITVASGGSGYVGYSGTTTSAGTTTTLTDTNQSWTVNALVGKTVMYTVSSVNYYPVVTLNSSNTLTFAAQAVAPTNGLAYSVGDTVLLLMDETGGPHSGNCYYQTQVLVAGVSSGAITSAKFVTSYVGGTPGVAGGGNGQFGTTNSTFGGNGVWSNTYLPSVVPADTAGAQPGTSGTGASFSITYTDDSAGGGKDLSDWPTAVAIKAAGYPVVISETGEHTGTGIVGSPYMAAITNWADVNGISILAFAYTPTPTNTGWYNYKGYDFGLTSVPNTVGAGGYRTLSPGYGQFYFNWTAGHPV